MVISVVFSVVRRFLNCGSNFQSCMFFGHSVADSGSREKKLFNSELAARMGLLLLAIYSDVIGYVPLVWTEVFHTSLLLLGYCLVIYFAKMATIGEL